MESELFFEIPDDQEVMVKLIEAMSLEWHWVDGGLHAPESLITSGQADGDTGFMVERFHSIHPTIVGSFVDGGKRKKPNLFAIMVEQKLPGFIRFDEAGYDADVVTLELAKRIATGFLRRGYRGRLLFFRNCHNNNKYDNSARCEMNFEPWHGAPVCGREAGPQPARVKVEWNGRYRDSEEEVAPIVAVCRSLGLREYVPQATATAWC